MRGFQKVFYVDLKKNYYILLHPKIQDGTESGDYREGFVRRFVMGTVSDEERGKAWDFFQPSNIRRSLLHAETVEYRYRRISPEGKTEWCTATFSACRYSGREVETVILSVRCFEEICLEEGQKKIPEEADFRNKNEDRLKLDFFSKLSHEIRTPLNSIIGFTELARLHAGEPDCVKNYLDKIAVSGEYMRDLVNDVLEFSKIRNGRMKLNMKPTSIWKLNDRLYNILMGQAMAKNLRFNIRYRGILHDRIMTDELRLVQVLVNLAGNAIKYTPENGSVSVLIAELEEEYAPMLHYVFQVEDNGPGISPEYLSEIFDAYSRGENSAALHTEGTGLGLFIVKSIVEQLGGTIHVRSTPGKGTCFTVHMSFLPAESEKTRQHEPQHADGAAEIFHNKRILLAEDDIFSAETAAGYLEYMGFTVDRVENGRAAVDMLLSRAPGTYFCILMDLIMPVLDGISAVREIRAIPDIHLSSIPIIAMTANIFENDQHWLRVQGIDGCLTKPVDRQALQNILLKLIDTSV